MALEGVAPTEVQRLWRNAKRRDRKASATLCSHEAALAAALPEHVRLDTSNLAWNGSSTVGYGSEAEARAGQEELAAALADLGINCQLELGDDTYAVQLINTTNQAARRNRGSSGLDQIAEVLMQVMPPQDAQQALDKPRLTVFNPRYDWASDIVWNGGHSLVYGENGNERPAELYQEAVARFGPLAKAWEPYGISCVFSLTPWANNGYVDVDFDADVLYVRPTLPEAKKARRAERVKATILDAVDTPTLRNGAATELVDTGVLMVDLLRWGDNADPSAAYREVSVGTEELQAGLKALNVETKIVFDPTTRDGSIGLMLKDRMTTKGSPMQYNLL
ncbi:MAG: hypothetical protein OXR66_05395 [Candidatus Woesearchaeota archaeon]|nr:hypothetical protein [Candidatus Woesearchaeota archaeon]